MCKAKSTQCFSWPRFWRACIVFTALLLSVAAKAELVISQQISNVTVSNVVGASQPDTNGQIIVTITNTPRGSILFDDDYSIVNIQLSDVMPTGYTLDPDFDPIVTNTNTASGNIDSVLYIEDPAATGASESGTFYFFFAFNGVFNGGSIDPNTGTLDTTAGRNVHRLEEDETLTLTFRIRSDNVIDEASEEKTREETLANTFDQAPPAANLSNDLSATYDYVTALANVPANNPATNSESTSPNYPDFDIDITGDLDQIISNNSGADSVTTSVVISNNGSADAPQGTAYVRIGEGWAIITGGDLPAGCNAGVDDGSVILYTCSISSLAPAATTTLNFPMTVASESASLEFNVILEGRIPTTAGDNSLSADSGLNYSLDSIRKDYIGFRLNKTLVSTSEPLSVDPEVQIGEDMIFTVTAQWFGYHTYGVSGASLNDLLPRGEGYVSDVVGARPDGGATPLQATSTPAGTGTAGDPVRSGLAEWVLGDFSTSNPVATGQFETTVTTRVLNVDNNEGGYQVLHGETLTDIVDGSFDFRGATFNSSRADWPALSRRSVEMTVITPNTSMDKQVCNLTRNTCDSRTGTGFLQSTPGAAGEEVIYRIVISNTDPGYAAAYDLIVNDLLPADLSLFEFATDTLDNDGDGLETVTAAAIEIEDPQEGSGNTGTGAVSFDFVSVPSDDNDTANAKVQILSGEVPEVTTVTVGPGGVVVDGAGTDVNVDPPGEAGELILVYKATIGPSVTEGQVIPNTASVSYDTIVGDFGSQTVPLGANGEPHGARVYNLNNGAQVVIAAATPQVDLAFSGSEAGFNDDGSVNAHPATAVSSSLTGQSGQSVTFSLFIANEGSDADSYDLFASADSANTTAFDPAWAVRFEDNNGITISATPSIAGGEYLAIKAVVDIPAGTADGVTKTIYFHTDSKAGAPPPSTDSVQGQITASETAPAAALTRLELTQDQAATAGACSGQEYIHSLRNSGTEALDVHLYIASQSHFNSSLSLATTVQGDRVTAYTPVNNLSAGDNVQVFDQASISWQSVALVLDSGGRLAIPLQGSQLTNVQVNVLVTCGSVAMTQDTLLLRAEADGVVGALENRDTTTVSDVTVNLTKRNALDSDCNGSADTSYSDDSLRAQPGECILWQVDLVNRATETICEVQIKDNVPAFTVLNSPQGDPQIISSPSGSSSNCLVLGDAVSCSIGLTMDVNNDSVAEQYCLLAGQTAVFQFGVQVE